MCATIGKIEVKLYVTPEELLELAKFLKKKSNNVQTLDGGEETEGGNQ